MSIKLALFLHSACLAHHLHAGHYSFHELDFKGITDDRILDIGRYNFRYFTSWNLILQTIYLTLSVINDFFILFGKHFSPKLYRKFASIRGHMFTAIIFPMTMVVFSLFWLLFSINREWVLPAEADKVLPNWLNHGIHTNILVPLIVELLLPFTTTPKFRKCVSTLAIFSAAYITCYFGTYLESGRWLYGIYDVMSWPQRIGFAFLNFFVSAIFMGIGIYLQDFARNFVGFKDSKYYKNILSSSAKKAL